MPSLPVRQNMILETATPTITRPILINVILEFDTISFTFIFL